MKYDVLIIGAGIAGLYTALSLPSNLKVLVLSKDEINNCNTYRAQGGIACVWDEDDDFEDFWCYFGKFGYGIELYKEFSESELMRAWLHPELIEVTDD